PTHGLPSRLPSFLHDALPILPIANFRFPIGRSFNRQLTIGNRQSINMQDFRELIESDGIHVFDGAMGTMLYSKGIYINRSYDELDRKSTRLNSSHVSRSYAVF